jgi:hypothetical protein
VLENLFLSTYLAGFPEAASVMLARLAQVPTYKRWAQEHRTALAQDPSLPGDERIQQLRAFVSTSDFIISSRTTIEDILVHLLEQNPKNRMAFEYLMAHYLLIGNLEAFIANLPRLDDFNYDGIPRHYEEAAAFYLSQVAQQPELDGIIINEHTRRALDRFRQRANALQGHPGAAWDALAPEFGNTYWFYCMFGVTTYSEPSRGPRVATTSRSISEAHE